MPLEFMPSRVIQEGFVGNIDQIFPCCRLVLPASVGAVKLRPPYHVFVYLEAHQAKKITI